MSKKITLGGKEDYPLTQTNIGPKLDSFGLAALLLKKGIVHKPQAAKNLSTLIMLSIIILSCVVALGRITFDGPESVPTEYYYDPTRIDNEI